LQDFVRYNCTYRVLCLNLANLQLYNFINQEDAKTNIRLARETERESAAMMVIAFLTTVFLRVSLVLKTYLKLRRLMHGIEVNATYCVG